jgi:hypothetical protein
MRDPNAITRAALQKLPPLSSNSTAAAGDRQQTKQYGARHSSQRIHDPYERSLDHGDYNGAVHCVAHCDDQFTRQTLTRFSEQAICGLKKLIR